MLSGERREPQTIGKYEVAELIGVGGYGSVYKGFDPMIKRDVAIKICTSDDPEIRDRFYREAEIAGGLDHPNIVRIHDCGHQNGAPYLIQEYLAGRDLERAIRDEAFTPFPEKLNYLLQIVRGLEYAHSRGVVHRDVKPANVRVLEDGKVKLVDFGIAKLIEGERPLTEVGMTVGTAAYLAPEQIRGAPADHRTDIFALGALAYQLLAGKPPFGRETISATFFQILNQEPPRLGAAWPGCPPEMERIVHRCLEKLPERRYGSCAEIGRRLDDLRRRFRESEEPGLSARTRPVLAQPTQPVVAQTDADLLRLRLDATPPPQRPPRQLRGSGRVRRPIARMRFLLAGLLAVAALVGVELTEPGGLAAAWQQLLPGSRGVTGAALSTPAAAPAPPAARAPAEPEPAEPEPAVVADPPTVAEPPQAPLPARLVVPRAWSPRMTLSLDGGAPVRLDGDRSLELSPGNHSLRFQIVLPGYRASQTLGVVLEAGEMRRVPVPLAPPGALTVQARLGSPQGRIVIDNGPERRSPLRSLQLAPGTHQLEIYPPAGGSPLAAREIEVRPGRELVVTFGSPGEPLEVRDRPRRRSRP